MSRLEEKKKIWDLLDSEFREDPNATGGPVTDEEEISTAERTLGVRFCEQYRKFLTRYGGAYVGAYPVYGLRKEYYMSDFAWHADEATPRAAASLLQNCSVSSTPLRSKPGRL